MNRHRVLERLRAANPIPGIEHVDADEYGRFVSYFETRRFAMIDLSDISRAAAPTSNRRLQAVLVFTAALVACVLVVGGSALLLGGRTGEGPATDVTPPVVLTTVPEATTVPVTTTSEAVPTAVAPMPESSITPLSDRSELFSDVALGPDGLPVVLSFNLEADESTGMIRLFRCADVACEEFAVEDVMEHGWPGYPRLVIAPTDAVYFHDGGEGTLWLYQDGASAALPEIFDRGWDMVLETAPMAFVPDGRPVFVGPKGEQEEEWFGASGEQVLNLVVCGDAVCSSQMEVPLETGEFFQLGEAQVAEDTIRVLYSTAVPTGPPHPESGYDGADMVWTAKLATVSEIDATPVVETVIVHEGLNQFPTTVASDSAGNLFAWFFSWYGEQAGYSLLSCDGSACAMSEPSMTDVWFFGAEVTPDLRPIEVVAETIYDPEEYAAYLAEEQRIAEQGLDQGAEVPQPLGTNVVIVECVDAECSTTNRSTIAIADEWWYAASLDLAVAADGTVHVVVGDNVGLRLYTFPPGTLQDLVDPYVGTIVR